MTEASKFIVTESFKLDELKSHLGSLNENAYKIAFNDNNFSLFPLFYLASKYFGDIYDTENETINIVFKEKKKIADKIKTVISTTQNGHAWVNPFAFDAFVAASNNLDVELGSLHTYSPSEIAFGIINLVGIEGALTIPLKTEVLGYIKATLDDDGWQAPPLFLMFKNIEDMYDDDTGYIENIKEKLGHLSLVDISRLDGFYGLGIDDLPDLKNYLAMNQVYANEILEKIRKLYFDWTTAIRGE